MNQPTIIMAVTAARFQTGIDMEACIFDYLDDLNPLPHNSHPEDDGAENTVLKTPVAEERAFSAAGSACLVNISLTP
jgi:hypothetical protein